MARRVDPQITGRALRAVRRARKTAEAEGRDLTEWEGEFLTSVEDRLETFGSAFADPDKGALCGALSMRQGLKLKQINQKAKTGEDRPKPRPAPKPRKPWRRKPKPAAPALQDDAEE